MSKLSFRIEADWQKVQKLREEISKLKQELNGVNAIQNPAAFNALNTKLQQTSQELGNVTSRIAQTSATMETDFKQKIFVASQSVNGFTAEIIKQKKIIADTKEDIRSLSEQYRSMGKFEQSTSPVSAKLKEAKNALAEQQYALFQLTQEQATARLSVKMLRDEYALFKEEGGGTANTLDLLNNKMKGIAATVLGGMGLKELGSRIISVRAEFESMETSLKVLLGGNQERLDSIMKQIKEYALASPLNTKDMVGAVQMMTSFGIEAEKSIDYLKAIGDISMGDTGKFNSLALAFSQMSSAGKLMGQDLLQMVNAGFNPLEEISRKTGKSIGQLKEEMSKGAISSKMVQEAFISVTSAGGKFYGMSSEGAKTLNGQISMLQESFDNMFNEIGQKGEGVVMTAVQMATKLVENYEQVGKVLAGLVTTYGAYRVGLAVATVAQNGHTLAMTLARAQILLAQKAQALLNVTMLANPYVLAATALGALIGGMIMQKTQTDLVNDATKRYNAEKEKAIEQEKRHNEEIQKLCDIAGDESLSTDNRRLALVKLEQKYPSIFKKYDTEIEKLSHIREIKQQITDLEGKASITNPNNELGKVNKRIAELNDLSKKKRYRVATAATGSMLSGALSGTVTDGLTTKEQAEYDALIKRKGELAKQISKGDTDKYLSNLTGISNTELNKQIKKRKNLLASMNLKGAKYGYIPNGKTKGIFSKNEIEGQLGILEAENTKRKKTKTITKTDLRDEKKKLQAQLDSLSEIEAKGKKGAELRKKINAISEREKIYSATNDTKTAAKAEKERNQRIKNAKDQQKANDALTKQEIAQSEAKLELDNNVEQSHIDSLMDGSEKTIAAMKLAHKREMEQIENQKRDYLKKKQEEAKAKFEANPKNKDKVFNMSSVTLSEIENAKFNEIRVNTEIKHENEKKELLKGELQSLYDYLKEYGTIQQQKYAIAKEYDEKIAKEDNENKKRSLLKEKEIALAKADASNIAMNIDWSTTFAGVGNVLKDIAKETLKEVEAYMKTDEFKRLSPESKKSYTDLRANLRKDGIGDAASPFNFGIWDTIERQTKEYQDSVRALKSAQKEHTQAVKELEFAQKRLKDSTGMASEAMAKKAVEIAQTKVDKTADEQNKAQTDVGNKKQNLQESTDSAAQGLQEFASALSEMSRGTLSGFANGVTKVITSLTSGTGKILGELGSKIGGIIGAILQILDALGDAPTEFIDGLLKRIGSAVSGIIRELPQLVVTIVEDIVGIIGSIIESLASWVGIDGIFGGKDNHKAQQDIQKELSKKLDIVNTSINKLTEQLGKSYGLEAIRNKEKIDKSVSESQSLYWKGLEAAGVDNYGGGHSDWYHWNKNSSGVAKEIANQYKIGHVNSWQDLFSKLSNLDNGRGAEILDDIRRNHSLDWWYLMQTQGYNGGAMGDWLTKWADSWKTIEESQEKLKEQITGTTEENVFNDFMNSLNELANGSENVFENIAENWQKMINKMVLNNLVGTKYQDQLKKWYKKFSNVYVGDKRIDVNELSNLKEEYNKIVNSAKDEVNALKENGLISANDTASQKATINEERSLSEDTGTRIEGRLTAIQIAVEQANMKRDVSIAQFVNMNATLADFKADLVQKRDIANETRDILANSYMELKEISRNTEETVSHLKEMKFDIRDLKRIVKDNQ